MGTSAVIRKDTAAKTRFVEIKIYINNKEVKAMFVIGLLPLFFAYIISEKMFSP